MSRSLDFIAHTFDRRTRKLIAELTGRLEDVENNVGVVMGQVMPSGGSTDGADPSTGVDYSTTPPTPEHSFSSVDERLDNLDANVGVKLVRHIHNGDDAPPIPARSVELDPSLTGESATITLEQWIAALVGKSSTVVYGVVAPDIPIVSYPASVMSDGGGDAQNIHGTLALAGGWTSVGGASHGVQNIRTASDGLPFDMASLVWRDRSFQPCFRIDLANGLLNYDIAAKWRHVADPNVPTTTSPIHLLVDMAVTVFGT